VPAYLILGACFCSDTDELVLACLKSIGPNVDHHYQLDRVWLEAKHKNAREVFGLASKALSSSAYTREERRAHRRQNKARRDR
jgi:hypothetical protein